MRKFEIISQGATMPNKTLQIRNSTAEFHIRRWGTEQILVTKDFLVTATVGKN
jgi:hypothetical protein